MGCPSGDGGGHRGVSGHLSHSYPAYKTLDEECRAHYRSKHLTELREDTQTRTMGLFEGGTLIATMKLILFSMNFLGPCSLPAV